MISALYPHQQPAAVIGRITGSAGLILRSLSMEHRHPITEVMLVPAPYILAGLQARYGPMEEEQRIALMQAFVSFRR